jgi:hypothetical protein
MPVLDVQALHPAKLPMGNKRGPQFLDLCRTNVSKDPSGAALLHRPSAFAEHFERQTS